MPKAFSCAAVGGGEGGAPFLPLGALAVDELTAADGPPVAAELEAETPVVEPAGAAAAAEGADADAAGVAACPEAENGIAMPAKAASKTGT
jgi:hypothetical protein